MPDAGFPLPAGLAEHARAWIERGGSSAGDPVPAKGASTVMLLRDAEGFVVSGVEVFVLRRASTMEFAASAYVFPGGGVDPRDADESLPWAGPSPAAWARRLAAPSEAVARELVVAAARELFEECGVLLAGPDAASVVEDLTAPEWDEARKALVGRELSFAEFLTKRGLVLRSDLLRAVDHWITPEFEPRRYDTRFFAAVLPSGQVPDDDCTEADHARWVRAEDLLDEAARGEAALLPPTRVSLQRLVDADSEASRAPGSADQAEWRSAAEVFLDRFAGEEPLPVVLPEPVLVGDEVHVVRRWAPVGEGA